MSGKQLSSIEAELYDRQIRLWGIESQERLRATNVLLINIRALGSEIAKNIILSGVNSLTILDDGIVTEEEQDKNFLLSKCSKGKKIAEEVLLKAQALNPLVEIIADTDSPWAKDPTFFRQFTVIAATGIKTDLLLKIDKICRTNNIKFIFGDVFGSFGYAIADFLDHIYQEDQIQMKGKKRSHDGVAKTTVKVEGVIHYPELNKVLILPNTKQNVDIIKKSKRRNELFFLMLALIEFRNKHNRNPSEDFYEKDLQTIAAIKKEVFKLYQFEESKSKLPVDILEYVLGESLPVCAIIGGVISQEVIKAVSKKEVPINNVFLFDPITYDGKEETIGY